MTTAIRPASRGSSALEVCQRYLPSKNARSILRRNHTPKAFFDQLVHQHYFADAVEFLARLLTKEQAIWWGCLCAWDAARPNPSPRAQAALQAALRWLQEPSEEHRRDAENAGELAGMQTAAGAVAKAVAFASGSMSQPGLPAVEPPADLTAATIGSAVRACAAALTAAGEPNSYRQLLCFGLEVASGHNRWK